MSNGDRDGEGPARTEEDIGYQEIKEQNFDDSRDVESMNAQREMLTRQVASMKRRLESLEMIAGGKPSSKGREMDQLTLKIEEVNEQVSIFMCD